MNEGEIYYLVLDNVHDNGSGHTLNLHYSHCVVPEVESEYAGTLNLKIIDKETGEPINSLVDIFLSTARSGKNPDFHADSINTCKVSVDNRQKYYLIVASKGFMNYTQELNFSKGKNKIALTVNLEKIAVGKSFMVENIFFYGNLTKILPTSIPALDHLLMFLNYNPTVNVEIQGHVNSPTSYTHLTNEQIKFNWKLSEDRAKAIYDYLIKNKIPSERLTYKGYGSTRMLFPNATTPREEQQNHRVEITITSY